VNRKGKSSLKIVFLGPPGAGKGTQANYLAAQFGLLHISTGDLLREAIAEESDWGKEARGFVERGELVPDQLVVELVSAYLGKLNPEQGFILDGFPRTLKQAQLLDQFLEEKGKSLEGVINFALSQEEIIRRLSARYYCPSCRANYNLISQPPQKEGVCDQCQIPLERRKDDQPEVIKERLKIYEKATIPLVRYYREKGLLLEIEAEGKEEEVLKRLREKVLALRRRKGEDQIEE
jgi:adenylate kinase